MPDSLDGFMGEEALTAALSLDRERLRHWRPKNARKNGAAWEWPQAEAEALAKRLGLSLAQATDDSEVEAAQQHRPTGDGEEVAVVSTPGPLGWHFGNHHLIRARRAGGEAVVVRVVDSRKYVPRLKDGEPMVLRARKAPEGNWWVLVGREPRWKGVW